MSRARPIVTILGLVCSSCDPQLVQAVTVPTGIPGVHMTWNVIAEGLDDGRYVVIVRNPAGEKRLEMWADWGPAYQANVYRTEDRRIVLYGMGGAAMISVRPDRLPERVRMTRGQSDALDATHWQFLGAIDRSKTGPHLFFYDARQRAECSLQAAKEPLIDALSRRKVPRCH